MDSRVYCMAPSRTPMIIMVDVDTYCVFGAEQTKQNKRMMNMKPSYQKKNAIETQNKTKKF